LQSRRQSPFWFSQSGCTTFKDSYRVDDAAGFSKIECKPSQNDSNATDSSTSSKSKDGNDYSPIDLCRLHLAGLPGNNTSYELASRCQYGVPPTAIYEGGGTIPADPQTCKTVRNALQNFVLSHSDKICAKHQAYIIANAAAWNIGTGFLANLFSGVGAVAGGASTKAALAGAAALSGGTRDLVDSEVYQKLFAAAIVKASDTERTKQKAAIYQNQTRSPQDYTVDKALDDAQAYHIACSFASGVQLVSQAVQRDAASYSSLLTQQRDLVNTQIKEVQTIISNPSTTAAEKQKQQKRLDQLYSQLDVINALITPALASTAGPATPSPPIALSPTSANLLVGQSQQFAVTLNNMSDTGLTWHVNGVVGGNSTSGTVSTIGKYTAPAAVPNPATVTVSATSTADPTKVGSAQVVISVAAPVLTISPASATVKIGPPAGSQNFSVAATTGTVPAHHWTVNGMSGGNGTFGTVSSDGKYAPPSNLPTPPKVTVAAVSESDGSSLVTAEVTLAP
jgi:hypothetical protein